MLLDPSTLIVVNVANLLVLATTLPFMMGQQLSDAARFARRALIVQAGGWIALILSGFWPDAWPDVLLSTLAMISISAANWLLFLALKGWLGPRRFQRTLAILAILMPIGYLLSFSSYPFRVGWSNLLIAAQLILVSSATLQPGSALRGRWRGVMFVCLLSMAGLTAGRGVLGAFFTELYPHFNAPHPLNLAALLVANITLVLVNVAVLVAWREEAEGQLRAQAVTDPLTGVLNRNGWNQAAAPAIAYAQRHQIPLALLTLDIDFFKQVNDTHGHDAGDAALRLFGRLLREGQRAGDIVARIGGEEFCVILPMAGVATAQGLDQRLRTALVAAAPRELGHPLDFSSGLACLTSNESVSSLMKRSDMALYHAKDAGRGRLVAAEGCEN
jgi:diguanylate cyclase (GGDEF)-like protein